MGEFDLLVSGVGRHITDGDIHLDTLFEFRIE